MTVSSVTILGPFDNFDSSNLRPHVNVAWAGGTGSFDVLYEWDDNTSFTSPITDTNVGVTSPDEGVPPSDMGGFGTPWYFRVTVTDHADDVDEVQSVYNGATGGVFKLTFDAQQTGDLDYNNAPNVSVAAEGSLTMDTQPTDGDTYTLDAKTYTFQTTLTNVDGNVNIGGSLAQAQANLVAAIDLSGSAGTDYATLMTAHTTVDVAAFATDIAVITAQTVGKAGNSIATTETFAAGTNIFDAGTLGTTTLGNNGVETELELFSNITDVSITGAGTSGDPWLLTFLNPAQTDVAMMTANDTNLTGHTVGTTIAEDVKGGTEVAGVASSINTLTFTDPDLWSRFLYMNHNVGLGFGIDPYDGLVLGDGDPNSHPRYLYLNHNITSLVPVPWIRTIEPTVLSQGDGLIIYGQGFDNVARDWTCVARLYDSVTLDGGFVSLSETGFVAGVGAGEDTLTVTVPGGAATGWVVVMNDNGL